MYSIRSTSISERPNPRDSESKWIMTDSGEIARNAGSCVRRGGRVQ